MTECELTIACNNTITYYINIIQNKYQGTNQQSSIFPYQVHISQKHSNNLQTNQKQDSMHGENKQTSVHIQ